MSNSEEKERIPGREKEEALLLSDEELNRVMVREIQRSGALGTEKRLKIGKTEKFYESKLRERTLAEEIEEMYKERGMEDGKIKKNIRKLEAGGWKSLSERYRELKREKGAKEEETEKYLQELKRGGREMLEEKFKDLLQEKGLPDEEIQENLQKIKQLSVAEWPIEKKLDKVGKWLETWSLDKVTLFIADRFLPLLYFPAWKEMWKMREEQRKREILYTSVGKIRNIFEKVITVASLGLARDPADYERRYEMIGVKKEMEELTSTEQSYLRAELKKALKAGKLDRAEACVRTLQTNANFNEIIKDTSEELGEVVGGRWNPDDCYRWLFEKFGKKRAHYMALDFAEDFIKGIKTFDQMVLWNEDINDFEKVDPWDQAIAAVVHSGKDNIENEWRKFWSEDMVHKNFKTGEVEPSKFLLARLAIATLDTADRGVPRAPDSTIITMNTVREKIIKEFVMTDRFNEICYKAYKVGYGKEISKEDIEGQKKLALITLEKISAKAEGKELKTGDAIKLVEEKLAKREY